MAGEPELVFAALGGVGEIGMNLGLYGFGPANDRRWIAVDCGVAFPGPDLPGVDEGGVEVRLENGVLSIDAAPGAEQDAAWTPIYTEYRTGGYHREFALSDAIDVTGIEARLTDGVLQVRLPKRHEARPRQITVQAG